MLVPEFGVPYSGQRGDRDAPPALSPSRLCRFGGRARGRPSGRPLLLSRGFAASCGHLLAELRFLEAELRPLREMLTDAEAVPPALRGRSCPKKAGVHPAPGRASSGLPEVR